MKNENTFTKGSLVKGQIFSDDGRVHTGLFGHAETFRPADREKLDWKTMANTFAPEGAEKAICLHVNDRAVIYYMDWRGCTCNTHIPDYGSVPICFDYGLESEAPESEFKIERL